MKKNCRWLLPVLCLSLLLTGCVGGQPDGTETAPGSETGIETETETGIETETETEGYVQPVPTLWTFLSEQPDGTFRIDMMEDDVERIRLTEEYVETPETLAAFRAILSGLTFRRPTPEDESAREAQTLALDGSVHSPEGRFTSIKGGTSMYFEIYDNILFVAVGDYLSSTGHPFPLVVADCREACLALQSLLTFPNE